MIIRRVSFGIACCLTLRSLAAADAVAAVPGAAATQKAQPSYTIGEMRIQTVPGFTYLYGSDQTTFDKIAQSVQKLLPPLNALFEGGKVRFTGPPVFIYHNVAKMADMNEPLTLDIGFPVKDSTAETGPFKVKKLPAFRCATLLYSGPLDKLPQAYEKLMQAMKQKNLEPVGEAREVYLTFESPESENNVVHIQIEIAPENPPAKRVP